MMVRLLIVCGMISGFLSQSVCAQNSFLNYYGSATGDAGICLTAVPGGGYLVGSVALNGTGANYDITLVRTDSSGNPLWSWNYGTIYDDRIADIAVNTLGEYYVVATTYDQPQLWMPHVMVIKLSSAGVVLWTRKYHENIPSGVSRVTATSDGGFIMTCTDDSANATGLMQTKIVRCNASGNVSWSHVYPVRFGGKILESPLGDFYISASHGTVAAQGGLMLIHLDSDGVVLWSKVYTNGKARFPADMEWYNGDLVVVSNTRDPVSYENTVCVERISQNGTLLWSQTIDDGSGNMMAENVAVSPAGIISIVGNIYDGWNFTGFVLQADVGGIIYTSAQFGFNQGAMFRDIENAPNGEIVVTGTALNIFGGPDTGSVFLFCTNLGSGVMCGQLPLPVNAYTDSGSVQSISMSYVVSGWSISSSVTLTPGISMMPGCAVGVIENNASQQFSVYPNPATSHITVTCSEPGRSEFVIFNAMGETVAQVMLDSPAEQISVDALSRGIYSYAIHTDGIRKGSGKFVLQ